MPFTPRRERERPDPTAVLLTDQQIADAMDRAIALRRRTAISLDTVEGQAMTVSDAMGVTRNHRLHSFLAGREDPWWWVGWVHDKPGGDMERRRTWAVWLNVADGRVWLRLQRGWAGDDE